MAFLDPKEDLLKIILTDHGRKKLSEGDFKATYYVFFDDEVDYNVSSGPSQLFVLEYSTVEELYFTGSGLPTGFTFERSSVGTYRTHSSSLASANANTARFENVGDSSGSSLLIEKSTKNRMLYSQELDQVNWEVVNAITGTPDVFVDPFGTSLAEKLEMSDSIHARIRQLEDGNIIPFDFRNLSIWVMSSGSNSPDNEFEIRLRDLEPNVVGATKTASETTWKRFDMTLFNSTGTDTSPYVDGIKNSSPSSRFFYAFGVQVESGSYPTSYIVSEDAQTARSADVVYATCSMVYDWVGGNNSGTVSTRYRLRPIYSAGDLTGNISGSVTDYKRTIQSWDKDQRLVLYATASSCEVRYFSGTAILSSSNINFHRDSWFDVELNVNGDSVVLEVASASAGNGLWSNSESSFGGFQSGSVTWLGSTTGSQDHFDGGIQKITKGRIANDKNAHGVRFGTNSGYSAYGADMTCNAVSSISCSVAVVVRSDDLPPAGAERAICIGSFGTNGMTLHQPNSSPDPGFALAFKDGSSTTRSRTSEVLSQSLAYVVVGVLEGFDDGNMSASLYKNGVLESDGVYVGYDYPDVGVHIGDESAMTVALESWTILGAYATNNAVLSAGQIASWSNSVTASLIAGSEIPDMTSAKYAWNAKDLDPASPDVWIDRNSSVVATLTGSASVVEIVPKTNM